MDSFPVAAHLANAAEFNSTSYLATAAAKASTQAYDSSLLVPFPALDPMIKQAVSSQFRNTTLRFSGTKVASPPLSGHIFHSVFRHATRARFEEKCSVKNTALPTLIVGSAFREFIDYGHNPNVSYWFYAGEPKDTARIIQPMLESIAQNANKLARESSVRFQNRSYNYNAALALLSKLDNKIPISANEWSSHFSVKAPYPATDEKKRTVLNGFITSQDPANSLSTKEARILRLHNAHEALNVFARLCDEPKLASPSFPPHLPQFAWGPNFSLPDAKKPFFRAVLHDVGYSFSDETWFKLFEKTGIQVANGYLFCPTRLLFPDMVPDPTYNIELIPNQPLSNPLAVWCDSNHWQKPTHTIARLTFKSDDGNGYDEDYDAWRSYLTRRVMVPKQPLGYTLLLDILERQGDYIIYSITRTKVRIQVPWSISVPIEQHYVRVFDIIHHQDSIRNPKSYNPDSRRYISVLESEWYEITLYIERTNPDSRCFHLALTSAYRKAFAILDSHDASKRWKLNPARICSVVLCAILYTKSTLLTTEKFGNQSQASTILQLLNQTSECFNSAFTFTLNSIKNLFGLGVPLVEFPEMTKSFFNSYDDCDEFGVSYLPTTVCDHLDVALMIHPPTVLESITCDVCKSLHPATLDGQVIKCNPSEDSSWEFNLSMPEISALSDRLSLQISSLANLADVVGLHTVLTNAKKALPILPVSNKVKVLVFLGGPGVGKTRFASSHRATIDTLVVSPYDLSQAYKDSPAKFMTQHKALTNTSVFKKVIVDEFQSMDLDLLTIILDRAKPDILELHGDPKQPNILENQGEGRSIVNHVLSNKTFTTHEYMLSYRCTLSSISILNNVFGYDLVTNSNTVSDIELIPFNPAWFENNPSVPVISFNSTTVASLLGTTPNPKFSVRSATGSTHRHLALVLTNDDSSLMNVDSLAIVAISRHTHQLTVLYQSDNLRAQFITRFHIDKLPTYATTPPRPSSLPDLTKSSSPILDSLIGTYTDPSHDHEAGKFFDISSTTMTKPPMPPSTVIPPVSAPKPLVATKKKGSSTLCGHPGITTFCGICSPHRLHPKYNCSTHIVTNGTPTIKIRKHIPEDTFLEHLTMGDGHCFYRAIAMSFTILNRKYQLNLPTNYATLRLFLTHNYLSNAHVHRCVSTLENLTTPALYHKYVTGVSTTAWGSATEAVMLSDLFNIAIHLVGLAPSPDKKENIIIHQTTILPLQDTSLTGKIPVIYIGHINNHFIHLTPEYANYLPTYHQKHWRNPFATNPPSSATDTSSSSPPNTPPYKKNDSSSSTSTSSSSDAESSTTSSSRTTVPTPVPSDEVQSSSSDSSTTTTSDAPIPTPDQSAVIPPTNPAIVADVVDTLTTDTNNIIPSVIPTTLPTPPPDTKTIPKPHAPDAGTDTGNHTSTYYSRKSQSRRLHRLSRKKVITMTPITPNDTQNPPSALNTSTPTTGISPLITTVVTTDQPPIQNNPTPSTTNLDTQVQCPCYDEDSLFSLLLNHGYPEDILTDIIHDQFSCLINEHCMNHLSTALHTTLIQRTVIVTPNPNGRNQMMHSRPVTFGQFLGNKLNLDVEIDVTNLSTHKWTISTGPIKVNTINTIVDLEDKSKITHPVSWSPHGILVHVPADLKCAYSALEASARMIGMISRFSTVTSLLRSDQNELNYPAINDDYQKVCDLLACSINIHHSFQDDNPTHYTPTTENAKFELDILIHQLHAHGFLPAHHNTETTLATARRIASSYANLAGGLSLVPNPPPFHTVPQAYLDLTTHYIKPADESFKLQEEVGERTFFAESVGLRPYDGFRLIEDMISTNSNLHSTGEEFNTLAPANINKLTTRMLNSRAKVNIPNLIQPLNKNKTPLKDEIDRYRYTHSQGIDFLANCPAQELRTATDRYINSKGIPLTAASRRLASQIATNFSSTYLTKIVDDPHEESETLNEALTDAMRKHYPEKMRDPSTFDPHRISFFMKEIFKVSRTHKTDALKAGQGISAWEPTVLSLFHALMRIMSRRFSRALKRNAVFNNRLTQVELITKVQAAMSTIHKSAIGGYMDGTQFDSCQNAFTQEIERNILTKLGMPPAAIDTYYSIRNDYQLSSNTFSAHIDAAKTSGEPGTLLLNTILMMCLTAWLLRTVTTATVIVGQGDDCFIYGIGLKLDEDRLSDVSNYTKMKLKVQISGIISFCGMSYSNGNFYLDLSRRYKKIVGTSYRDYTHFAEVQNSIRDFLLDVKQSHTEGISSTIKANISVPTHHPDYSRQFEFQLEIFHALESLAHINSKQFREHFRPFSISRTYPR